MEYAALLFKEHLLKNELICLFFFSPPAIPNK